MKDKQKEPQGRMNPANQKNQDYPGNRQHEKPSGKSPESDEMQQKKPRGQNPEGRRKDWDYPEETAHVKNERDIANQTGNTYKKENIYKGRPSPDDDEDFDEDIRDDESMDDDEEF